MTDNDNVHVVPKILTTVFTYNRVLADQQISDNIGESVPL